MKISLTLQDAILSLMKNFAKEAMSIVFTILEKNCSFI
jgi:hypothetical protein